EEEVFIDKRSFHAVIYQFRYEQYGKSYERTYWLAPGCPDGVIRYHEKIIGVVDPAMSSESDMRITDLNVALKAGKKTVHGYCFETEDGVRGGKFSRDRICTSKEVPGAIVTAERTELVGTIEKEHVRRTVENFKVIR